MITLAVKIIILGVVSFLISWYLNHTFLSKAKKYTLKKANESGIRWSSQSKPVSGGITFFVIFFLTNFAYFFFIDEQVFSNTISIGVLLIVTVSFLMGLADDIINSSPFFKLFIQILSGFILINFGFVIDLVPNIIVNYAITIFWVVGIMNSINMLDNMDAVTTVSVLPIITASIVNIFFIGIDENLYFFTICICLLTTLLCFLLFNWNPAKMYMGDNGSQFLGAILAAVGILFFWNNKQVDCYCHPDKQILIVVFAFFVPIADSLTVTLNRLLGGRSPFIGGRDHFTHHLSYLGLSEKQIALILLLLSTVMVSGSLLLTNYVEGWGIAWFLGYLTIALVLVIGIFILTRISKPSDKNIRK